MNPPDVTLREYIESLLHEREKAYLAQLSAAEKQLTATAITLQERLAHMNEFRQQISAERALYVQRDQLQPFVDRLEKLENWRSNVLGRQVVFGLAILVLAGLITVVLRLVGH